MIDYYKVITFNHHSVEINGLGKYQVQAGPERLAVIKNKLEIEELVYISTCNRVMYLFVYNHGIDYAFVQNLMTLANPDLSEQELARAEEDVCVYEGQEAVQHVFEVAGSVDSLVVGESEIFFQFKSSFESSKNLDLFGDKLRLLENSSIQVAKRIYSHTRINEKPLSIAVLAGQAILENNHNTNQKIALIGAGETNTLVTKFLYKHKFTNFTIFNRSRENGLKLSELVKGKFFSIEEIANHGSFDVVICCTSANKILFGIKEFDSVYNKKSMLLVDLSVPSNVDHAIIASGENLKIVGIEDLKILAEKNLKFRKQEVSLAKTIIEEEVDLFHKRYLQRQIELALSALPQEIQSIKDKILLETFADKIEKFDEEQKVILSEILDYMQDKCIAAPLKIAKSTIH